LDVLFTPVGDLLCGRIGPRRRPRRPRPHELIGTCGLPAGLSSLVWDVVRRTRLWSTEKVAVARELIAHFEDGLAMGTNAEELGASFGDPARAAALIRRAKRRNRGLIWKAAKLTENAVAVALSLALLLYTIQAVRLYGRSPNVAHNYLAEWNQEALTVPPAERAWPIYQAAIHATLGQWQWQGRPDQLKPGSEIWPEVAEFARSNGRALELYRQAAAMPKLGIVLGSGPHVDDMLDSAGRPVVAPDGAPDPNPEFLNILLPPPAQFRQAARLLLIDAYLAAETGNSERICADLEAAFGTVAHVREARMLITDLVALAVAGEACAAVDALLRDRPEVFDESHLTRLAHRLAGLGDLRVRFSSERAMVEDFVQRYFTDDGTGDGLARPELLSRLAVLSTGRPAPTRMTTNLGLNTALMPALSAFMAGRREMRAKYLDFLARYEAEAATPLWQRGPSTVDAEIERLCMSPFQWVRYAPIVILMPAFTNAGLIPEYSQQHRDATLVALALELYHRRHAAWPQSLEELVPQLLPRVPLDRYDGQPLKYRLLDDRPLLYSVGVDRKDDGGRLPFPPPPASGRKTPPVELNAEAGRWCPAPTPQTAAGAAVNRKFPDGDWILWPPVE
jgi:hypothetical protein